MDLSIGVDREAAGRLKAAGSISGMVVVVFVFVADGTVLRLPDANAVRMYVLLVRYFR